MKRISIAFYAAALAMTGASAAADPLPGAVDWSGAYVGVHGGGALARLDFADPFGTSIFGDTARTTGFLGGIQAGYNWQFGAAVVGLEADASLANLEGTSTCFAYSGFYVSSYCRTKADRVGTIAGRLGWALPGDQRTLLFGKGGLAWEHDSVTAYPNRTELSSSTRTSGLLWGWVLGGGVERALNARWSLKAEYDYMRFGDQAFATPESRFQSVVGHPGKLDVVPQTATAISQDVQLVKIGLNYRFGADANDEPPVEWGTLADGAPPQPSGMLVEAGVRYVRGWGRFQKDQKQRRKPEVLQSKLTYDNLPSDGGEVFARIDMPFNVMVKGVVGSGSGGSTQTMHDEDWGLDHASGYIPYSNTVSDSGYDLGYYTADAGYDVWRTDATKIALFGGYSYFKQELKAFGCKQIADPISDCSGRHVVPTSDLGLTDTDTWRSPRVGIVIDTMIAPGLTLSGEVAYLPRVKLTAINHHLLKDEQAPEWGEGNGVQLEATLSYALTDTLRFGVGGRYWSMRADGATLKGGDTIPMHFAAEQAALLVQGSYAFDLQP